MTTDADAIFILGNRDPDAPPSCLISWCGQDWVADVKHVRSTALDLMTCAAYADMLLHLTLQLGIDPSTAGGFAGSLIYTQTGRQSFGSAHTISLLPVGSTRQRMSAVRITRGRLSGLVTAAEAREMSLVWLSAAEAAESDQVVAEALRAVGRLDEDRVEQVFTYMRELRSSGEADHD
ncbi:hypothetical protein [Nonomuraea sp. NPDC050310]|uniref:hypothetical protein n=1 Tax=Nonomuraea sp. NPDC050310 TaxID=3154935 RepID=UPI00340ABE2C